MSGVRIARTIAKLVVLSLAACTGLAAQQQRFSGSVRADHPFVRNLGRGLVLVVSTSGFAVQAAPFTPDGDNFAACVTTPAYGPNPIDLQAWLFDSAKNPDPHPLHREFDFTLNAADDKIACDDLDAVLHGKGEPPGYQPPPEGQGVIDLSNVKLSHPATDADAEIESFNFVATITLPALRKPASSPRHP